ncbi:MAG: YncE family protein [Deltaproteobacteria bacterium]|nr:YncE family protein [Deltaproteobacteria bacterium]
MSVPGPRVLTPSQAVRLLALLAASGFALGADCGGGTVALPGSGSVLYESPQVDPLALSADGTRLYVANTTSGTLSVLDVTNPASPRFLAEIKVGHDPVGVAVRPKAGPEEDELVFVTNHVSDSISVVSRAQLEVVQTIQALDANGVTTTDEPVGIAFAGPDRAFVALDQPNQVLRLDLDAAGTATIHPTRLAIRGQAPRALAVAGNRLYVAAFESGNETELGTCAPGDPRGLDPNPAAPDQGCEFELTPQFFLQFAQSPNVGGRVIHDTDVPDRDLFVFDTDTLAPVATIEGVGTLLYGVATSPSGSRIYVTNTNARNLQNGLLALGNRAFENRLSYVDCVGGCASFSPPVHVDLDASAPGAQTVPTPYGIAASADGDTLVVTAAGSDGQPGLPGLFTLDGAGTVLGAVVTGAIPQGVALRSDPATGAARTAYVLDTVQSRVTVVDVSNPGAPATLAALAVGSDPTPAAVRRGRIAFHSARGSTSATFACGSCHPAGNEDQLLWTINTAAGPGGTDPNGAEPEPRTTMPIRGLRDTLPLHWDGSLGDPFPGVFVPGDSAPDCSLAGGDHACFRDLVDASLAGVMCDPTSCPVGPSGLPGALDGAQRDDMATFLGAVSYPPSPARRPTDALTAAALQGARDFFTADDGGGLVGLTCADNAAGCHSLPLGVVTNSSTVGGFDAPTMRGMWDRSLVFSNAIFSSQEALVYTQGLSGETIWNPAVGMTERGSFLATFPAGFQPVYGVPGPEIWEFITQMSVGLPGLTGRQISLSAATAALPATVAAMDQLEAAAALGKVTAVASVGSAGQLRYVPATGKWTNPMGSVALTGAELRSTVGASADVVTLTADLPAGVQAGGARQPLLSPLLPDPGPPDVPRPAAGTTAVVTLAQSYVDPAGRVLVDGAACAGCSFTLPAPGEIELTIAPVPAAGPHVVQVLNPNGLASNEMPIISQ